jgi:hypothetical protein
MKSGQHCEGLRLVEDLSGLSTKSRFGPQLVPQDMTCLKLELTLEELTLLASLASDQLFRREFIDPKMPGYKADPADLRLGKSLVGRMQQLIGEGRAQRGSSSPAVTERVSGRTSKRPIGSAGAV